MTQLVDFYERVILEKKRLKLNNVVLGAAIDMSGDAFRMALNRKSLSQLQIREIEKMFDSEKHREFYSMIQNFDPANNLMVKEAAEQFANKAGNVSEPLPNGRFRLWTKKLPIKAFASYLSDFRNVGFFEELDDVSWIVDHAPRGRYMTIEAEGDSMNGGGINDTPDRADMLGRELQKHHWKDGFRESHYGWVIVHKDTVVFKDITDFNNETGDIVCHSRSGLPQHPDFTVNLNDVIEIWKVIKRQF